MPLVQGGPPQWTWERPAEQLKWELKPTRIDGQTGFELRIDCGLEIVQLHVFTQEELDALRAVLARQ